MIVQRIRFPVTCPVCKSEFLSALRVSDVKRSLNDGRPLRLYASCHNEWWNASSVELEQVREYLGAAGQGLGRVMERKGSSEAS